MKTTRYVLRSSDGRLITNDTQNGASLTKNPALCYLWESIEKAELERTVYQAILGTALSVEIHVPGQILRRGAAK
jgi:hypothetical protein